MTMLVVIPKRSKAQKKMKMRIAMEMKLVMDKRFKLPLNLKMVPAKDFKLLNLRKVCHLLTVLLQLI